MTRGEESNLKSWLMKLAASVIAALLVQTLGFVWWAATITAQQQHNTALLGTHTKEIQLNRDFRILSNGKTEAGNP